MHQNNGACIRPICLQASLELAPTFGMDECAGKVVRKVCSLQTKTRGVGDLQVTYREGGIVSCISSGHCLPKVIHSLNSWSRDGKSVGDLLHASKGEFW